MRRWVGLSAKILTSDLFLFYDSGIKSMGWTQWYQRSKLPQAEAGRRALQFQAAGALIDLLVRWIWRCPRTTVLVCKGPKLETLHGWSPFTAPRYDSASLLEGYSSSEGQLLSSQFTRRAWRFAKSLGVARSSR
jgi:hypothetical protein